MSAPGLGGRVPGAENMIHWRQRINTLARVIEQMAQLYFYYSAMNAGKSTALLQSSYNYQERGRPLQTAHKPAHALKTGFHPPVRNEPGPRGGRREYR